MYDIEQIRPLFIFIAKVGEKGFQLHPQHVGKHVISGRARSAIVPRMAACIGLKAPWCRWSIAPPGCPIVRFFRICSIRRWSKIDKSFVRDILHDGDDLALTAAVIGLARAFGRQVIAEGLESIEHGEILLQLGCEMAQGDFIAQPMSAADVPGWVAGFVVPAQWRVADASVCAHGLASALPPM